MDHEIKKRPYIKLGEVLARARGESSQQQWADIYDVSQTAVTQWESGYKRPRPFTLARIAFDNGLDPRELSQVGKYNEKDQEKIANYCEDISVGNWAIQDLIEIYIGIPDWINKTWFRSDPELAIDEADNVIYKLRETIKHHQPSEHGKTLLKILSKVLFEQACAYWVSLPPNRAWKRLTSMAKNQVLIAEEIDDDEPLGWAFLGQGNAWYGLKKYGPARTYFNRAIEIVRDYPYRYPLLARTIALTSAYLGDNQGFKEAETLIDRILDEGKATTIAESVVVEGLARAQSLLDQPNALTTIDRGWKILAEAEAQGEWAIVPRLQMVRSNLEAVLHVGGKDKKLIESIGNEGLSLAHEHYAHYASHIETILSEILN